MSNQRNPDITAILTAHREGWMVYPAIASMLQAIEHAEHKGLSVEMLVVLDRPDAVTEDFVKNNCPATTRLEYIDKGDPAISRNHAVSQARGKYLSFLDGDDLWCKCWLLSAFNESRKYATQTIWHPEADIGFGNENFLVFRRNMNDPEFNLQFLNIGNCWSAHSFALRDIYQQFPYLFNEVESGFGHEDWQWNCETINSGILHMVVPGTTHFLRRKSQCSQEEKMNRASCLMTPSNLFNRKLTIRN
jgi:glycosyltransferase involved in cell wall biosynthesis